MYRNKSLLSVFSPLASWLQKHPFSFSMALLKALYPCHGGILGDRNAPLRRSAAPAPPHRPTLPRGAASRLTSSTFPAGAGERFAIRNAASFQRSRVGTAYRSPLSPFPAGAGERLPRRLPGGFYRVFQRFNRIAGNCQQKKRTFVLFEPAARITRESVNALRR